MTSMTPMIFAIDPGNVQSAWVFIKNNKVVSCGLEPNHKVLDLCKALPMDLVFSIEMIAGMGMAVGKEVFETVFWIGRFWQMALEQDNGSQILLRENMFRVFRLEVKLHLCGVARAKDANIRCALIDKLGPPGTKKQPGATYGVRKDIWSALAIAVYTQEVLLI